MDEKDREIQELRRLEGLDIQKNNGVILLGPELEFCGVMPRDAEIEVIRKAADDD